MYDVYRGAPQGFNQQEAALEAAAKLIAALGTPFRVGPSEEDFTHVKGWDDTRGEHAWFTPIQGREELLDAFQQGPDYQNSGILQNSADTITQVSVL